MNNDPLTAEELAELQAKWEAATGGVWKVRPEPHDDWGMIRGGDTGPVASTCMTWRYCDEEAKAARLTKTVPQEVEANAEAIAALHNAFPRLLATLAERERELRAWEKAVEAEGVKSDKGYVAASRESDFEGENYWQGWTDGIRATTETQQALLSRAVGSGEGTSQEGAPS